MSGSNNKGSHDVGAIMPTQDHPRFKEWSKALERMNEAEWDWQMARGTWQEQEKRRRFENLVADYNRIFAEITDASPLGREGPRRVENPTGRATEAMDKMRAAMAKDEGRKPKE